MPGGSEAPSLQMGAAGPCVSRAHAERKASNTMDRTAEDRRDRSRFEIVGTLWGRVDAVVPLVVQNIGRGGALLESPSALPENSVHWVTLLADGQRHRVQIRVCHTRLTSNSRGAPRFAVGVEFLALSPAVGEAIERLSMGRGDGLSAEL